MIQTEEQVQQSGRKIMLEENKQWLEFHNFEGATIRLHIDTKTAWTST